MNCLLVFGDDLIPAPLSTVETSISSSIKDQEALLNRLEKLIAQNAKLEQEISDLKAQNTQLDEEIDFTLPPPFFSTSGSRGGAFPLPMPGLPPAPGKTP